MGSKGSSLPVLQMSELYQIPLEHELLLIYLFQFQTNRQ
jgi:hypothetical protein